MRLLFTSIVFVYAIYLLAFKCHNLNETALEHGVESVLHPLSHHHNQVCDGLNKGVNFVSPYLSSVQSTVVSHPLYKQYAVQGKVDCAYGYYKKYASQHVLSLFKLIETYERIIADRIIFLYGKAQQLFATHVAPTVKAKLS